MIGRSSSIKVHWQLSSSQRRKAKDFWYIVYINVV